MSAATAASLVAVVVALISGVVTLFTSRRAHKLDEEKADAAVFERARLFTDQIIANLQDEVDRLNNLVASLRSQLEHTEAENLGLRTTVNELTRTANNLRWDLTVLQRQIAGG